MRSPFTVATAVGLLVVLLSPAVTKAQGVPAEQSEEVVQDDGVPNRLGKIGEVKLAHEQKSFTRWCIDSPLFPGIAIFVMAFIFIIIADYTRRAKNALFGRKNDPKSPPD